MDPRTKNSNGATSENSETQPNGSVLKQLATASAGALKINEDLKPVEPVVEVEIDTKKITPENLPIIKKCMTQLIEKSDTPSKIILSPHAPFPYAFDPGIAHLQIDSEIVKYPDLFIECISALKKSGVTRFEKWHNILSFVISRTGIIDKSELIGYFKSIEFFAEITQGTVLYTETLITLLNTITTSRHYDLIKLFQDTPLRKYKPLIQHALETKYQYIVFRHINEENDKFDILVDTFGDFLVNAFGKESKGLINNNGQSLLHCCNVENHFKLALGLTKDINAIDSLGDTALHLAALDGNIAKIHFLILNGADPTIKNSSGKTYLDYAESSPNNSTRLYSLFKKHGSTLQIPPKIVSQQGMNCGFYAIACASYHHRVWKPALFTGEHIPARKRDVTPKASRSLRQFRKELGIKGVGSIFSVSELQMVIDKTECKSLIIDITNYDDFLITIEKCVKNNLPIIIPFSAASSQVPSSLGDAKDVSSGSAAENPTAETAHWATIIGVASAGKETSILLAQWGKYDECRADKLFNAFYNIEELFPEKHVYKTKETGDWNFWSPDEAKPPESIKFEKIRLTSLTDFRRKLVVVLPPQFDIDLLQLNTEKIQTKKP